MRVTYLFIAVLLLVPVCVEAQTGGVTLKATVSETVALSVLPNSSQGNVAAEVVSSGNSVRITLSGGGVESPVIRVPLLVRSNSGFGISAVFESTTAALSQLSVVDVHASGSLVSPQLVTALNVRPEIKLDVSRPLLVLSGPRVSLGGTLNSPNNALEVTLLIRLQPQSAGDWSAHLTFLGTAEPLIQ